MSTFLVQHDASLFRDKVHSKVRPLFKATQEADEVTMTSCCRVVMDQFREIQPDRAPHSDPIISFSACGPFQSGPGVVNLGMSLCCAQKTLNRFNRTLHLHTASRENMPTDSMGEGCNIETAIARYSRPVDPGTPHADIYSLGATLFFAATGLAPHKAEPTVAHNAGSGEPFAAALCALCARSVHPHGGCRWPC